MKKSGKRWEEEEKHDGSYLDESWFDVETTNMQTMKEMKLNLIN